MKKAKPLIISIITILLANHTICPAQAPSKMNYQAVIRNISGDPIKNTNVSIEISILKGSSSGPTVFTETYSASTNAFGLVNLGIGSNNPTGFSAIDWSDGLYFIKLKVNGTEMGTSQLLSVPYALYAKEAGNTGGGISNWQKTGNNIYYNNGNVGINASNPQSKLCINENGGSFYTIFVSNEQDNGTGLRIHSSGSSGNGIYTKSTGVSGTGIWGRAENTSGSNIGGRFEAWGTSGWGVYGLATGTSGRGVYGEANNSSISTKNYGGYFVAKGGNGRGVYGEATGTDGIGVYGNALGTSGNGVYGEAAGSSGNGVYGFAYGSSGKGVYGNATGTSGFGVYGIASGSKGNGVYGQSEGSDGQGIYGYASGYSGKGVYGFAHNSGSTANYGGYFVANGFGVYGKASAIYGSGVYGFEEGTYGYGIYGETTGSNGTGVHGSAKGTSGIGVSGWGSLNDFYAYGPGTNYASSSSKRWKNDVQTMDSVLIKLANLRGVYFNWDEDHGGRHDLGFIAEEVGEYFPEVVSFDPDAPIYATGMDYGKMTPVLLQAIKEQQEIIEKLQQAIDELMLRVEALEK